MPHGVIRETIPATSAEVFRLLHDYDRRLEWDTLLRSACLVDGWRQPQVGAVSICTGKRRFGRLALKTVYVSFRPTEVAAVRLVSRPPFFETFAATIRHRDLSDGASSVEYTYHFTARPAWLRLVLHPIMAAAFASETRRRLRALKRFFEERRRPPALL